MRTLFRSVAMAFSMFSVLPMPPVEWKRENMKYMLCALPLVGAVIAAALCLWHLLCQWLTLGEGLYAAGMTLLPLALSGGIHMDGFCDTVDALASHAPPERKREILKDSHAGAFAVIFTGAYLLLYYAACTEPERSWQTALMLGLHQILARAVGALAGTVLPSSGGGGLLASFRDAGEKRGAGILTVWVLLCGAAMIRLAPAAGLVCILLAGGCFLYLCRTARKEFGGMSGDLAGYLITLMQLALLMGLVLAEKVVAVCF